MKTLIFTLITLSFSLLFISFPSRAIVGEDDRFYVHSTKWDSLFRGVFQISKSKKGGCTGFLLEGDIAVTASHCWRGIVNENMEMDHGELSKYKVYFGDSVLKNTGLLKRIFFYRDDHELLKNHDELSSPDRAKYIESLYDHSTRSKGYSIKDIYAGHSVSACRYMTNPSSFQMRDFSFFTLKEPIPKTVKRFKLLGEMNLEDYDILDPSSKKGLYVSFVSYTGETGNTSRQRLAHIGCRIRDIKQKDGGAVYMTDCDNYKGGSGGPLFKILKHKKTGKIELGALGVASIYKGAVFERTRGRFGSNLGYGRRYTPFIFEGESGENVSWMQFASTSGKDFIDKINLFRKDPAFFKGKEISFVDNEFMKEEDIRKEVHAMKDFSKEKLKQSIKSFVIKFAPSILCDKSEKRRLSLEKIKEVLSGAFSSINTKEVEQILDLGFSTLTEGVLISLKRKDYPRTLSKKSRGTVYGQEIPEHPNIDPLDTPSDSLEESKEKANKMWRIYFGR